MWEIKEGGRKSVGDKGRWQEECGRERKVVGRVWRERKVVGRVWERKEGGRKSVGDKERWQEECGEKGRW